ncbi:mitochondrial 37S ribosomal protein mS29 [Lodderomyces beijingensis]|uniref:Small ribosomal subunit protein mS29 n=1 Tax=Lodderomyces beijingensis TaxID=1775926 RepID=A0ABP0ZUS6_9ASCO
MLRCAASAAKGRGASSVCVSLNFAHSFTTLSILNAAPRQKEGKAKQVMGRKNDKPREKVKKTTALTPKHFRDAIRVLGFENLAPSLTGVKDLSVNELKTGTVTTYAQKTEDSLRASKAFKKFQYHEMFKKPVSLVTSNTVKINDGFVEKLEGNSIDNRVYLDGAKGCGKSTLMNQAIALALDKYDGKVIVLHLHTAELIGNGSSDYFRNEKLGLYQQPMATKRWLTSILASNAALFKTLKLTEDVTFVEKKKEVKMSKGKHSLYDYLSTNREINRGQPTMAFQFIMRQIQEHSKSIPVLLAIDDFNTMADQPITKYFDRDHAPIDIQEFELADYILRYVSGESRFEHGGVLLGKSQDVCPDRKTVHLAVYQDPKVDPYLKKPKLDLELAKRMVQTHRIEPFRVDPMTHEEVRALMSFWRDQNVLLVRESFHKKDFSINSATTATATTTTTTTNNGDLPAENPKAEFDADEQFEKICKSSYVISQGNPHGLIKQNLLSY